MSSRILYYINIVKGEHTGKTKKLLFVWIVNVEPNPILYKYSESIAKGIITHRLYAKT